MTQKEYVELLHEKRRILAKITDNTERQVRFIRRQAMVGLNRLLRERSILLDEMALVIEREREDERWRDCHEAQEICREIQLEQEILMHENSLAVQSALHEKMAIANQLCSCAITQNIRKLYIGRWYQELSRGFCSKA